MEDCRILWSAFKNDQNDTSISQNTTSRIRAHQEVTEEFIIMTRVKQGCALPPLRFIFVLAHLLNQSDMKDYCIQINGKDRLFNQDFVGEVTLFDS